jgi:hypothetical protein
MSSDELPIDLSKLKGLGDQSFRAPDIIGTVEGWRAWGVPANTPRYAVPKLYSVTWTQFYWSPRQLAQAVCDKCGDNVPGEHCTCGFYSAKTFAHLQSMSYHQYDAEAGGMFHVVGQVANWGKVVEGSQGWRSQKSYPAALYVPFEAHYLAARLGDTYGVPVRLKNILVPGRKMAI